MSNYHIKNLEEYFQVYRKSVSEPENFWAEIAEEHFVWQKKWNKVLEYDFEQAKFEWFKGAKLNITENCIDRHLLTNADKTAIIFEPNNPKEKAQHISYQMLSKKVNAFANVLKNKGIKKGDRVCIYLPMIPELAYAVLACARIGAIHSVVFAGFSAKALSSRINDCDCKMVITSDGSFRGAKTLDLKSIVDKALETCSGVESVLVAKRINSDINLVENRDFWLEDLLKNASTECKAETVDAEDPLFILYTSGSTGKPKGMVHTTAGYMVNTAYTFKNVFQYQADDIYWCTADIGWITGHSYIVYGPLANGATTIMFEGVPSYPDYGRFWEIVAKHKVNQFYTAPTAIRALAKEKTEFVTKHDLSSLKILGTVGEPINEEAWHWYNDVVGNKKSPIVDTWWQTETGWPMSGNPVGLGSLPVKLGSPGVPMPGYDIQVLNDEGQPVEPGTLGNIVCKLPLPPSGFP